MGGSGGPCGSSESYEPGWDSVPGGCGGACVPGGPGGSSGSGRSRGFRGLVVLVSLVGLNSFVKPG